MQSDWAIRSLDFFNVARKHFVNQAFDFAQMFCKNRICGFRIQVKFRGVPSKFLVREILAVKEAMKFKFWIEHIEVSHLARACGRASSWMASLQLSRQACS